MHNVLIKNKTGLFKCHCTTWHFQNINRHSEVRGKVGGGGRGLAAPETSSKLALLLTSTYCILKFRTLTENKTARVSANYFL